MKPPARLAAAIDILAAIDEGKGPADETAAGYFRGHRYIGAKDRAAVASLVYGVLRERAALDWWIARADPSLPIGARSRLLAALELVEGWSPKSIASSFSGGRFAPSPLTGEEERFLSRLAGHTLLHPQMRRSVRCGIPPWLEPNFERAFGGALESEAAALGRAAPVDLRVNLLKSDREGARRALLAEGVAAEPTPFSPVGLRLSARTPLRGLRAFKEGLVEPQDEGSQLAALLADARPGMTVVDFCAGAGGKTLALAAAMRNRGRLVACDVSPRRLESAARRLARAGVGNVERRLLSSERDKWVKRHEASFDRVFLDVPCLGTGTWRRNPDMKWRMRPEDLGELLVRQREILKSAARLVRPGGRLIYVTCSFLCEENEDQIEIFLVSEPSFSLYPAWRAWEETMRGCSPAADAAPAGERYLRLTPARHGTDGFFVAILERRS